MLLLVYRDPRFSLLGWRAIASSSDTPEDDGAYVIWRISKGVPEFGEDFSSEDTFLLDVNYDALNAVNYKKGCFVGQEVTSRMKRKGDVRKRTLVIRSADEIQKGATVKAGEQTLGEITSAVNGSALALIRIDRLSKANDDPSIGGAPVTIEFPKYLET